MAAATMGVSAPALKTMPVSEIRAGMKGYGLSVFQGTEPERFDVEVIGVLHNFRPDQDLVLIKTPHPLLDHTGSVAGMSGSPIYLDNRLVGAYAYGWSFGKDPIAGVTPISNMLKELTRPQRPNAFPLAGAALPTLTAPQKKHGYLGDERRGAFYAVEQYAAQRGARAQASHPELVPCATPLLLGGVTSNVARVLRDKFAPLGLEVLEAASGGGGQATDGPEGYVDGGSIAVTLLRGDIQATAVGTVTHVDGHKAIAFGHPMLDAGEIGLPTATSRVLHVLASERSSFKIAEAIQPLGAMVHDRQAAIVVDNTVKPATLPIRIRVQGLSGIPREHWQVEAVNHKLLTPSLLLTALGSALSASVNDADSMMFRAETQVHVRGHGVQHVVDEGFAPGGMAQVGAMARLRVFDLVEAAYYNPFGEARIERIDITLKLKFAEEITELVSAQLTSEELNPGEYARVVLTLRPYRGELEQRVVSIPIPENLAGESLELEISSGADVRVERPIPRTVNDVFANVRAGIPSTSLVVSLQRKARGLALSGHVIRNLPGSMLDTLSTGNDTARTPLFATQDRSVFPMGRVIFGQAKLALSVRKEKQ